ncbi:auxilin-like clathrin-binding protein required for normal clathrin function [Malassezia brasiliensis]|uniref:Auxilin-like clathrin-binding protein required for normal clathrin function n=1 Tax=Malassezia brasiliensis TaxID=1821822 RepID=A0AAF0DSK3_9BASI|nr:auxilin-like clathrin-binding protein required for normal clathrin function [Malassezia brasiliensis]
MDDLANLDFGASAQQRGAQGAASSYNFDALLRSMPSTRSASPHKPAAATPATAPKKGPAASAGGTSTDAFSSLLPTSFASQAQQPMNARASTQNSTLAAAAQARTGEKKAGAASSNASPFDGLDQLGTARASAKPQAAAGASSKPPAAPATKADPFDFDTWDSFGAASQAPTASTAQAASAPGFDLLDETPVPFKPHVRVAAKSTGPSEADLLEDFFVPKTPAAPAADVAAPVAPTARTEHGIARGTSPPPHVVGQLVEMGFAPDAARRALARTPSGVDIEAALTTLTNERGTAAPPVEEEEDVYTRVEHDDEFTTTHIAAQRAERTLQVPAWAQRAATPDWQKQADQLRAQATELGSNMLKNANAFWGNAKAQAQRALDEVRQDGEPSAVEMAAGLGRHAWRRWGAAMQASAKKPIDYSGKPRWMQDAAEHEARVSRTASPAPGSAEREVAAQTSAARASSAAPDTSKAPQSAPAPAAARPAAAPRAASVRAAAPATNPSLLRRPLVHDDAASVQRAADLKAAGNAAFQRGAYGEAEEHYTKALSALDQASIHRVPLLNNRANVRLKNGDSDGAVADCTANMALIVLPGMHMGDGTPVYRPEREAPLDAKYGINLREAYGKSVSQRARAYEAREKWAQAHQDWNALLVYERTEGSGVRTGDAHRRAATDGLARCDKMLRPAPKAAPQAAVPRAANRPAASDAAGAAAQRASDAGRDRVRAQLQAQEAEEAERLVHKDAVEAKLEAWTNGKRGNVRALLCSVDDPQYGLLWPALQWKKVQLHELVTDAQVKRAFTRAIAKLHPDKLKPSTTNVEQRMIATGVFHALNEAFHG